MKTLLAAAALAVLAPAAALACPCHDKEPAATTAAAPITPGPGEALVTIPVSGMHCDHCATRVTAALSKVDGVKTARADHEKGQAVVTVDKGKLDADKLVGAIDAAGFKGGAPAVN